MDLNDQLTGLDYASPFMATSTHVYVPPWAPKRCGGVYIVMLDERNDGGFLPRFRLRGMSYLNITEIGRVTADELHYHNTSAFESTFEFSKCPFHPLKLCGDTRSTLCLCT